MIRRVPGTAWFSVTAVVAVAFAANPNCGANDASVGGRDTGSADIINMPNHFSSIAVKCDGPNRLYESEHGDDNSGRPGGLAVVTNDPRCAHGGK